MPITVYAAKVNGADYSTVPMNVKGSGAGGNGGSAARIKQTSKLDPVGVSRYNADVFGSRVLPASETDADYADKALTSGTFAHNHVKPIGPRQTAEIAGQTNTFLLSGANVPSQIESIHFMKICGMGCVHGVRTRKFTTAIRENRYNRFTGQFDSGYPQESFDEFDVDNAAVPTRTVPGQLVFKTGKYEPVSQNYEAKNG
jgi:hypothetical protein